MYPGQGIESLDHKDREAAKPQRAMGITTALTFPMGMGGPLQQGQGATHYHVHEPLEWQPYKEKGQGACWLYLRPEATTPCGQKRGGTVSTVALEIWRACLWA